MQAKIKGRTLIWTGDIPAKHFTGRGVDLSIEFQVDAVVWLENMKVWWKKYEDTFWKCFTPKMNAEIHHVVDFVMKLDAGFDKIPQARQAELQNQIDAMIKAMGARVKAESQACAQLALTQTMDKIDLERTKTKVFSHASVSWSVVGALGGAAAAVAHAAGPGAAVWGALALAILKLLKDFETAQKTYQAAWMNLQEKAKTVRLDVKSVDLELDAAKKNATNQPALKATLEKLRAAGKKLKGDADAMDVQIILARKSLDDQAAKLADLQKQLHAAGKPAGVEKAQAAIKAFEDARLKSLADLEDAGAAKREAEAMQAKLAAFGAGDGGKIGAIALKVDGAADKVLKGQDVVEKGKVLVKIIEGIANLMKVP